MTRHILLFDQHIAMHRYYLTALQDVAIRVGASYETVAINVVSDVPYPGTSPVDGVVAVLRDDRQVYQLVPRLYRLIDARRTLLLVAPDISPSYVSVLRSMGSTVNTLVADTSVPGQALAALLDLPIAAARPELARALGE
jgi:hypothetical protein